MEKGYAKLDARVALSRGPWELAVVGRNLTDETSFNLTNRLVGSGSSVYRQRDRDRHVLLQAGYRWE